MKKVTVFSGYNIKELREQVNDFIKMNRFETLNVQFQAVAVGHTITHYFVLYYELV